MLVIIMRWLHIVDLKRLGAATGDEIFLLQM